MADEIPEKVDGENQETADKELLEIALKRFALSDEAFSEINKLALEDIRFSVGEQWDEKVKQERFLEGRPCLTINRMPQFCRQIENDQRQNRPAIKYSPVDDKADIETAKVFQGVARHVEHASNADTAYDTAFKQTVRGSYGVFGIMLDYCDPMSMDQDIRIRRIRNQFSAKLDPNFQEPDGSDMEWAFIFDDVPREQFKILYPNAKAASTDWEAQGLKLEDWVTEEKVRVAEYFYKEYKPFTLALYVAGVNPETGEAVKEAAPLEEVPPGAQILAQRPSAKIIVHHVKLNGAEVLERTIFPGRFIPIIPVLGDEIDIEGKRVLEGLVRHAKDSQRMYNFMVSYEAEAIALAPKAPYIGAEGQFEGHESQWDTANRKTHAYLEYKPVTLDGQLAPPPQRQTYEPAVQAISNARMLASEDLKATTGIQDAALGITSNEKSGIAIQRRANQTQTNNFHFIDNLSKSIRHAGRIILELIPHVYDTDRAMRILGEDGSEEIVYLNKPFERNGKQVEYRTDVGKYDVTVSTGPSYETKRQEAVASMLEYAQAQPQHAAVIGDLLVKNMDFPQAEEIGERIKRTIPPHILGDNQQGQEIPPQAQAQMAQMQQVIEQLTGEVEQHAKMAEMKAADLASKERIEFAKIERDYHIKLAELDAQDARLLLQTQAAQAEASSNRAYKNVITDFENEQMGAEAMPEQGPSFDQPMPLGEQYPPSPDMEPMP